MAVKWNAAVVDEASDSVLVLVAACVAFMLVLVVVMVFMVMVVMMFVVMVMVMLVLVVVVIIVIVVVMVAARLVFVVAFRVGLVELGHPARALVNFFKVKFFCSQNAGKIDRALCRFYDAGVRLQFFYDGADFAKLVLVYQVNFVYDQRVAEFEKCDFEKPDFKSDDFMIIEISLFPGRSKELKGKLIETITGNLKTRLSVEPSDVFILINEPPLENWGIGGKQRG